MNPKKLNIEEAWRLYHLLGESLYIKDEEIILDVLERIVSKVSPHTFSSSLDIMYGSGYDYKDAVNALSMFYRGIRENMMPRFYIFIDGITNADSRRARPSV